MYIRQNLKRFLPYFLFCFVICLILVPTPDLCAQEVFFVANTNSPHATAYNNSHNIALKHGESINDTIYVVFVSSDSIYFIFTVNQGTRWSSPMPLCEGKFPAFDVCPSGFRHVAWQSADDEIYYDCLDDWSPPVNVSQSQDMSSLPDIVVDSNHVAHIAWAENVDGRNQIYYRTVVGSMLGDTACVSGYGSNLATYDHPGISIFSPNNRVYVIWECYDSLCYSPYQIHLRYAEGDIWSPTRVWAHYLPMRHPSIDYSHGEPWDTLSFCYEDSTTGTMQATFYGGNGGGYATSGYSTYPVVSTVGPTWSYLFWQEDSAGDHYIFFDLYYFQSGWTHGCLGYQESVRFPSVCGAYVIWTQGDTIPYSIYFANFGYPIGIQEIQNPERIALSARPNPFTKLTTVSFGIEHGAEHFVLEGRESSSYRRDIELNIYDAMGRVVKSFAGLSPDIGHMLSVKWFGEDNGGKELPAGVYWLRMSTQTQISMLKLVKVD